MILFVYFTLRSNNKNNEQFLKKKTLNRICRDQEAKITINAGAFDTDAVPVYQVEKRVLQDDFDDKSMLESL